MSVGIAVSLKKVGYTLMPQPQRLLLRLKKRTTRQEIPLTILREVNLTVPERDFCLITGPSGSGKTTLLQLIALLLHPTKGTRLLFNREVTPDSPLEEIYALRGKIGLLFQTPFLPPELTVKAFITSQAMLTGVGYRRAEEQAEALLEELQMSSFADLLPRKLSGGERQRVALASLLIQNIRLLLLDEPTGSLDAENKQLVWELIFSLKKKGLTVVAVSHDTSIKDAFDSTYRLHYGVLEKEE